MGIGDLTAFENILESGRGHDMRIMFWKEPRALTAQRVSAAASSSSSVLVILGPEADFQKRGGRAEAAGFCIATRPRILRPKPPPSRPAPSCNISSAI